MAGSNYTCYGLNRTHSRHNPVLIRSLLHRNYNSIQSTALHLNSLSPLRDVSSHISAENSIHNLTRDSSAENSCSGCCCLVDADISLDDIGTLMIYNDHLLSLLDYDVLAVLVNWSIVVMSRQLHSPCATSSMSPLGHDCCPFSSFICRLHILEVSSVALNGQEYFIHFQLIMLPDDVEQLLEFDN